jgi:hypothetical protein
MIAVLPACQALSPPSAAGGPPMITISRESPEVLPGP